ncbi:hypothetical protein QJS10_CPA03g01931 [Acorus calamus]|uniref:DUF7725 domain-containing protein n=1 Tax=Acorus calamus TaxID=4465 RepID=A0AAV9F4C3_ACOCL|nr:hypothetical protein QJS10_CPA03g01931 [Acorus calamus]
MDSAAVRGGATPPMPSSQSGPRKEWQTVPDNSLRQSNNDDQLERGKIGQSDERTVYEEGTVVGPLDDMDFSLITGDADLLQQQLHDVSRRRGELQQLEVELQARVIARTEILGMQDSYNQQMKEQADATASLKEQLENRDHHIHDLQMEVEEREREIRAAKINNEAQAWAKEDLLREQNKELATFRRERDNTEAERTQYIKQIHELQEHIREKEGQYLELEEQHRVAQEAIIYKDEQLREAQAWVSRVQELNAVNQSLQTELRDHIEQFNLFWFNSQRQYAEMEQRYVQTIQQLQLELAETREKNGTSTENSQITHVDSDEPSSYVQNMGIQFGTSNVNSGVMSNGNTGNVTSVSAIHASIKTDHVHGSPIVPSSIIGMNTFVPPGQLAPLHPFMMHQQGLQQSVHTPNSLGHFQQIHAASSGQHWQSQEAVKGNSPAPTMNQYPTSQIEPSNMPLDSQYDHNLSVCAQQVHSGYLESHNSPQLSSDPLVTGSNNDVKGLRSNATQYIVPQESQQNIEEISSQFHAMLGLKLPETKSEIETHSKSTSVVSQQESLTSEPQSSAAMNLPFDVQSHAVSLGTESECNTSVTILPEAPVSATQTSNVMISSKGPEPDLLEEGSLLACIVRAIPSGSSGQIKISTTLPNRLGRMLSPLHWHDYKKKYGKLDDFVARHPELFVIEGDFIHLREGAQEIISATAAVAKVAAVAAASVPYSSFLSSVAVTPVAQTHRLKLGPSTDTKPGKTVLSSDSANSARNGDLYDNQIVRNQQANGVDNNPSKNLLNVKILNKSKDFQHVNGSSSEVRPGHSSGDVAIGNGARSSPSQNKGPSNGKHGIIFGSRQQGRTTMPGLASRR